ncbi:hypothetical protein [Dehalogenimonas alkenigignens]|uniref:Uncharacterized protein n=1 Tax=Dehalogenimonas alkenigignens TaxID=1217799 RepID=A0A0W0GHF3_9CHLR|nr:hypothetical protein [Dehalogenimonas alkenigignens]KTB47988.1 hypothetical protein DEALK_08330 [Dehalogenimonas alkenigignens]PVV84249.1 hypothetical protein DD509_02830 [Dehalogenimonas alkenigignens]
MIITLAAAVLSIAWGLLRVMKRTSSATQQGIGLTAIIIGMIVALIANLTDLSPSAVTAVALVAAAGMLVLAVFAVRAMKRPEGGATNIDLAVIMVIIFSFIVGGVFHG